MTDLIQDYKDAAHEVMVLREEVAKANCEIHRLRGIINRCGDWRLIRVLGKAEDAEAIKEIQDADDT